MKIILSICGLLLSTISTFAAVFEVGPTKTYTVPSAVAGLVSDGDIVQIDAGTYIGDVATWTANNLTLIGVGGGRAHLRANGNSAGGKAIWVIQGNNTHVLNIEFSECAVFDKNGAGIRAEGDNLTVTNCYFHDNENGILAGDNTDSVIIVEHSEFGNNGYGDGLSHNIYINRVQLFILQYCYMHHAHIGHNVKSRAYQNLIQYNRIMDELTGDASMLLDLSNGGESLVVGNLFHQGQNATNKRLLTYGLEGLSNPSQDLYIINNTFVNERFSADYIVLQAGTNATIQNNAFGGVGTLLLGTATLLNNMQDIDPANFNFMDLANYNYELTAASSLLIDAGSTPGYLGAVYLGPVNEYEHPLTFRARQLMNSIDIGAYEYVVTQPLELEVKVLLQGPYNGGTGLMNDDLRTSTSLPLSDPYSLGYTTTTAVLGVSGSNAIVDWIVVQLRDANTPATVLQERAALLQRDGDVVDVDGISPILFSEVVLGDYQIVVQHRNHLGVLANMVVAVN